MLWWIIVPEATSRQRDEPLVLESGRRKGGVEARRRGAARASRLVICSVKWAMVASVHRAAESAVRCRPGELRAARGRRQETWATLWFLTSRLRPFLFLINRVPWERWLEHSIKQELLDLNFTVLFVGVRFPSCSSPSLDCPTRTSYSCYLRGLPFAMNYQGETGAQARNKSRYFLSDWCAETAAD